MSKRLTHWVEGLKDLGMSGDDIASGLENGDIERPEWLSGRPGVVWDNEESGGQDHPYSLDDY